MLQNTIIQDKNGDDAGARIQRRSKCPVVMNAQVAPMPDDGDALHVRLWHIVRPSVKW
jgi:hypothetical protein